MANQWLRLWHDMPNDPKWRTISRLSGQPMALVQSIYIHLMVSASQNVTRGHADVTNEDLASHFDVTERDIDAVISAMQGRVLEDKYLTGWERRQPKKEDYGNDETGAKSATQRKREQRDRERLATQKSDPIQPCHDESRHVTTDKDKEEIREDINKDPPLTPPKQKKAFPYPDSLNVDAWEEWKQYRKDLKLKAYAPTSRSEGAAITNLINLSGGEQGRQAEIIKQSMANCWQGLFELKPSGNRDHANLDYAGTFMRLVLNGGKPANDAEAKALKMAQNAGLRRKSEIHAHAAWRGYLAQAYKETGEAAPISQSNMGGL